MPGDYSSIQQAIDASVNSDTVLIEANIYLENIDFNGKNIVVGSYYLTTKDTSHISQTVIDGSETDRVVTITSNEDSTAKLIGLTICNGKAETGGGIKVKDASPRISYCIIINNKAESSNGVGGGIYLDNSHSIVSDCEIRSNAATGAGEGNGRGGGIGVYDGEVKIVNCSIHENSATFSSGGIGTSNTVIKVVGCVITKNTSYAAAGFGCQDSDVQFINNTLANNKASSTTGGLYFIRSSPIIKNSIIWYNMINSGYHNMDSFGGTAEITYSNIQGGWEDLDIMDLNPMFEDTTTGNFQLAGGSPCIDAGNPDTTGIDLPTNDLNGNNRIWDGNEDGTSVIDMGAYEYDSQPTGVKEKNQPYNPKNYYLLQSYPNPFNSETVISFFIPKRSLVNLKIYNIAGQEIVHLTNDYYESGTYQISWAADNQPTGLYICQLLMDDYKQSMKLILQR